MGWALNGTNHRVDNESNMIYLTYGDTYSGVFQSQVIEVCEYLSDKRGKSIRLISFVPYPVRKEQKEVISKKYAKNWVFSMFPAHLHWFIYFVPMLVLFLLFIPSRKIICRGALAGGIGLRLRSLGIVRKVVFDGRGAQAEEWKEYGVGGDQKIKNKIYFLEKKVVLKADINIAVSDMLVKYWEKEFGFTRGKEVIIPCTLGKSFLKETLVDSKDIRTRYGFTESDIILVYSGSSAEWQSFQLLNDWLDNVLCNNEKIKILFLSKKEEVEKLSLYNKFSDRIAVDWLKPDEVFEVLRICDYGLLYREKSITNQVASPTKYAEYLAAGLKILISEGIGDYTELTRQKKLGEVISSESILSIEKIDEFEKKELHNFALQNFTKQSYDKQYGIVIDDAK